MLCTLRRYVANLSACADCWVFCYPNAGLPNAMGGYDQKGAEMAEEVGLPCAWYLVPGAGLAGSCMGSQRALQGHLPLAAECATLCKSRWRPSPSLPRSRSHAHACAALAAGGTDAGLSAALPAQVRPFCESRIVNALGGCCGTTPDHIRCIVGACRVVSWNLLCWAAHTAGTLQAAAGWCTMQLHAACHSCPQCMVRSLPGMRCVLLPHQVPQLARIWVRTLLPA